MHSLANIERGYLLLLALFICTGCEKQPVATTPQTVILAEGDVRVPLYVPAPFDLIRGDKGDVVSLWISFEYPASPPQGLNKTAGARTVDVEISLVDGGPSRQSRCDFRLEEIMRGRRSDPAAYPLAIAGQHAQFKSLSPVDKTTTTNYFFRHADGELSCVDDSTPRPSAMRRYAGKFELSYIFPKELLAEQLKVDTSVTTLVASLLKK